MAEVRPRGHDDSKDIDSFYTGILKSLQNADASMLNGSNRQHGSSATIATDLLEQAKKVGSGKGKHGPSFVFSP